MLVRTLALPALALVLASMAWVPSRALAYEERVTVELGLAPTLRLARDVAPGVAGDFLTTWGVSNAWSLGGSLRYAWAHDDSLQSVLIPTFDVTWSLDILRVVPRISLGLGAAVPLEAGSRPAMNTMLRLGIDRLTESGLFGVDLRLDARGPGGDSSTGRLTLSLGFRWGFMFDRF